MMTNMHTWQCISDLCVCVLFFKQKTAYDLRISDWSSDVCSSDLANRGAQLFRSRGIAAGDTVAIWLKNCLEYFQIYWAAQRVGLYICPISSQLTAEESAYIANDSHARLLITHDEVPAAATLVRDRDALLLGVVDIFDLGSGQIGRAHV